MSDEALIAVATPTGWTCGETTWHDDRLEPTDDWRPRTHGPSCIPAFRSLVERLDFARYEGVYRRESPGQWSAFLACWFAFEHRLGRSVPDPRGDGALVAIGSAGDVVALRRWVRAAKGDLADAIRRGDVSDAAARKHLLAGLRRRASDRTVVAGAPTPATER